MFPLGRDTRAHMKRALFSLATLAEDVQRSSLTKNPDTPLDLCAGPPALLKALGGAFESGDVAFASASSLARFLRELDNCAEEIKSRMEVGQK